MGHQACSVKMRFNEPPSGLQPVNSYLIEDWVLKWRIGARSWSQEACFSTWPDSCRHWGAGASGAQLRIQPSFRPWHLYNYSSFDISRSLIQRYALVYMHAWLTGWRKVHGANTVLIPGTYLSSLISHIHQDSGRTWRKHRLNWNLSSLIKNVRAFTQKRFRSAQPRMLKGHIWVIALQSQSGSQLVKFCLRADYFLTWRIGARSSYEERVFHPGLLPAWGAGAMERHCHSLAGMAPL